MQAPSSVPRSAARRSSIARPRRASEPAMSVDTLALVLAMIFGGACLLLALFIGSLLYMVVLHHRLKGQGLTRERALLATPLPPDSELPHVVVQIPSFNEGTVLRRGVEAAS